MGETYLTSFVISQIVNKDCLPRAKDCFIADFDTETKDRLMSNCWMVRWRSRGERGGRDRGKRGGTDRGKRGGRDRGKRGGKYTWNGCRLCSWEEGCSANTETGWAVTKTHLGARESAAAATREPVTFVSREYI
jgi:hypothetical protein